MTDRWDGHGNYVKFVAASVQVSTLGSRYKRKAFLLIKDRFSISEEHADVRRDDIQALVRKFVIMGLRTSTLLFI